jgi:osmotically-inducible protein OsmY
MIDKTLSRFCCLLAMLPLLQACAGAVVATGVAAGAVAVDRRTTGTMIDDQTIEIKARQAFLSDSQISRKAHVSPTSFNGVVLLTGQAPNVELKARAEELVTSIPKVRSVHNELVVAAPSAMITRTSDTWITGKVKSNLLASDFMDATRTKVVTENGTVYLMGLVTRAEGDQAARIAHRIGGVQRVVKVFEYLD